MENKNISKVKRGEIYLYDFGTNEGSIQNGLRPALVVQCDEGNKASCTTVIAAMTTVIKKRYLPSHIILRCHTVKRRASLGYLFRRKYVFRFAHRNKRHRSD